jgi:alkane 1-monooxygenase
MRWSALKYALPFGLYIGALRSFSHTGFTIWFPILFAFALLPLLELFIKPDNSNLTQQEENAASQNHVYDWLLYLIVPLQYTALFLFLFSMQEQLTIPDRIGRIMVMGLICGIFGINAGHELGHRVNKTEQFLARCLLLTSLYMNFFIEHNRGHHKYVGTPEDPSTARLNEPLYLFWFRSVTGVYLRAWSIASQDQKNNKNTFLSNEMLHYQFIEIVFCLLIGFYFGWAILGYFLASALVGILLLETVNYIEHYGLMRKPLGDGKFERAMPEHSWNSDHVAGRLMLFELSRHSDHHFLASRKYQLLRHHENSPQLPTGYPGSMILAAIPPLWFRVMNKKIKEHQWQASASLQS